MPYQPLRFLVIRLSSIGDIVHALPAVAALGDSFPAAVITWVVERRLSPLLEGNPYVQQVLELDTLEWRRHIISRQTYRAVTNAVCQLRSESYRAAIDFQGLLKSGLIAYLSGAPERWGFAEYWLREPLAALCYTEKISPRHRRHVIEMNLALVERLGATPGKLRFPLPCREADEAYVMRWLASRDLDSFVVINPGGGWRSKCWPPGHYSALIRALEKDLPARIVVTGAPAEEGLIEEILTSSGTASACYLPTNITQFIALARRARLFLGGDTGPLHLAAAVGTPVVGIYGPTDPARNGPFSSEDRVVWNHSPITYTRREANAEYIQGIAVEEVLTAIRERWARAYG